MQNKLGALQKVDIRSMWTNEASDFTPWLAQETNLSLLGNAVGFEMELEHTEVAIGSFSADIVARDINGNRVVIENQLSKTDHDHLGKAITYAAFLHAKSVIWVAPDFTDEHYRAINWLNENVEELGFYAVQIELWSIDNSAPAVRFNVLGRPTVNIITTPPGDISESRKLQLEWWIAFRDALQAQNAVPSLQTPRPQYWYNIALGRTGIHLSCFANTFDRRIGVRVYMMRRFGGDAALRQLLADKDAIEREIGAPLTWDANPDATDKSIALTRDADLSRKDKWPEYLKWLVDMTVRFRRVFAPRIRALDLSEPEQEASGDEAMQQAHDPRAP